jgi:hypothetical protein
MFAAGMSALGKMVDRISPWLTEFGSWIFGGLIAFILLVLPALITIGPADTASIVATVAFALALPLDLAGLIVLRLVQDLHRIGFAGELAQAFQEAGFPTGEQATEPAVAAYQLRRTEITLLYALGVLALSVLLIFAGLVAALWHVQWWIAAAFSAMIVISAGVVVLALAILRTPETPASRARQQRYWDEMTRRARESAQRSSSPPPTHPAS